MYIYSVQNDIQNMFEFFPGIIPVSAWLSSEHGSCYKENGSQRRISVLVGMS